MKKTVATPKSKVMAKAAPPLPAKQASQGGGDSSSDSDSSSSEEEEEEKTSKPPVKKPQKTKGAVAPSKPAATKTVKAKSSSSSSDDSSEEDEEEEKAKGKGNARPQAPKTNGTSALTAQNGKADRDSEEEEEGKKTKAAMAVSKPGSVKKRKQNEVVTEAETPQAKKIKPQTPNTFPKRKKAEKRASSPFRRIREEEIKVDARVADNSFDAKRGAAGDWGERANEVLKFTKGKSFRHEKTKKKRGSYRGGSISVQVNSIKFDSE